MSKSVSNVESLLHVSGLTKKYSRFELSDISFDLPAGYIMGYIGRNGAGKTTTLNAVTGLIVPDAGEIRIGGLCFDEDPVSYKEKIGYIGDSSYFPIEMTAAGIRSILSDFYTSFRPEEFNGYLKQWKIEEKKKIKDYSRGMKVMLMFASVLSRDTDLLVLDEATNGLDPVVRRQILRLLQEYVEDGTRSVIFSTHILDDLEEIADYIFFINNGKKVLFEASDELKEKYILVRGGGGDLTDELAGSLIGLEKNEYSFSGLFDADAGTILPGNLVTEKPSIDEIIVRLSGNA